MHENDVCICAITNHNKFDNDLKNFFDTIFNHIISKRELIEFELIDDGTDMFREVDEDVIDQLNSEIKYSENNFKEFLELLSL